MREPYRYYSISKLPQQIISSTFENIMLGDDIIPFYIFLILVILMSVLFILFMIALVEFVSAIVNNQLLSFSLIIAIFSIGYKLSEPYTVERHKNLSPFTMHNPARIINGTYNVTALSSILILLFSTTILLLIGIKIFKTKEI